MGCGSSSKSGKYATDSPKVPRSKDHESWATPPPEARAAAGSQVLAPSPRANADGRTQSYRRRNKANNQKPAPSSAVEAVPSPVAGPPVLNDGTSPTWEVQEFDKDESSAPVQHALAQEAPVAEEPSAQDELAWENCTWWAEKAEWIYRRSADILAAYNFFFEHIGLRKGWRVAPFGREEVQAPFRAAAEIVVVIRAKLDNERGSVVVLRQVEGSAMNFLWGWSPDQPPGSTRQATEDFLRGLVFATLSDGKGLVEGLDSETVESYVCCHPLFVKAAEAEATNAAHGEASIDAPIARKPVASPASPHARTPITT